jgi:lipoate-protein ligase B
MEYGKSWEFQRKMQQARLEEAIPDTILLLEHEPVFTLGKSAKPENLLASREQMNQAGISLFFADRGGDITYHGPGQLVVYPILDLRGRKRDLHQFVFDLEEVILRTLQDFDIEGVREARHPGIWIKQDEIAMLGLSVRNWITLHGIALNVNTNLEHFALINPCGFSDRKVTSMARLLSREIPLDLVALKLVDHFCRVFNVQITWQTACPGAEIKC